MTFDTIGDLDIATIVDKVINKEISSIKQLVDLLQAAKKLPNIIAILSQTVPENQESIENLQKISPDFIENFNVILDKSWINDAQSNVTSSAAAVEKIQNLGLNDFLTHAKAIENNITSMVTSLQSVIMVDVPSLEGRVASYQRWSTPRFAVPCLKTGKITLSLPKALGGFSQKFDYPQFFRCDFDFRISFSNHHIPHIKVTFKTGSRKFVRVSHVDLQSGEDTVGDSNNVLIPAIPQSPTGLISDAPSEAGAPKMAEPDNFTPDSTEVTINDTSPEFSTPSSLYTNSNEVVPTASFPSAMGFLKQLISGVTITGDPTPKDLLIVLCLQSLLLL